MFDRTTWIALILSIVGLVVWQSYYTKHYPRPVVPPPSSQAEVATVTTSIHPTESLLAPPVSKPLLQLTARRETIETAKAEYLFESNTGGIEAITLFIHLGEQAHSLQLNALSPTPIGALQEPSGAVLDHFFNE